MGANKQICRLCLEEILDSGYEDIDEIKTKMLETLLIKVDFNISDSAVVCYRCLDKIQSCFEFKSNCFYVNNYFAPFVDNDTKIDIRKVFEKEVSKENVSLENCEICRLCLSLIEDDYYTTIKKDGAFSKVMIANCLPEVELNVVQEPLICKPCLSKIINCYEFMKMCQEVQEKIKNYFTVADGHGTSSVITLFDVKFTNRDMISDPVIKIDYSDVNIDVNINHLKKEETESIKVEEIDIKDELDWEEMGDSICSEDVDKSVMNDSSTKNRKVPKRTRKRKKESPFLCPKCPYSTKNSNHFKKHMSTHSDNEVRRCTICDFVTDSRLSLKAHMSCHRGSTKAFGCSECPFETNYRQNLQVHGLTHKDKSEVKMQKCPLCPYMSKYQSCLFRHRTGVHGKNVQTYKYKYKCKKCSFSTKSTSNLLSHQVTHMKPNEIQMYRCEKCEFETKYRIYLIEHLITHSDSELVNTFSRKECPGESSSTKHVKQASV